LILSGSFDVEIDGAGTRSHKVTNAHDVYDVLLLGLWRIEQVSKNGIERDGKYECVEETKSGPILAGGERSGYPPYPLGRIERFTVPRCLVKKKQDGGGKYRREK
jgi:hypothetical protein